MKRRLFLVAIAFALCFCLSACGISKQEAVGTWRGTYVYGGNQYTVSFDLDADGDYSETMYKDGAFYKAEEGTWEVKGGKVILHNGGGMGGSTEYKYKDGVLVNNDHEYFKK